MMRYFIILATLLLAAASPTDFPSKPGEDTWANRPNDPRYLKDWQLFSHFPSDLVNPIDEYEKDWGSGMHVDKAWQLHTGTPTTVIAVLDSGIKWDAKDLVDQIYLKKEELPKPEGASEYDANQDGRFSVSDYAGDSRVTDINQNGLIDAGDLIKIFSNGIDEDHNGYIDDISGWDFHEHNNDPGDRTLFGHGTSQAMDSVAKINNGVSAAGICGHCTLMPLRVDDSFVADANAYARAVIYAADHYVTIVQQALGSINWTPLTKIAVDYAYDMGTTIIGSAADEYSFHHNYPATLDPVIYTNAIRSNTRDVSKATTFLNLNNCTNYGARVDVSTSGAACSSEATANLSGIAALTSSYGKSRGREILPGELTSLIRLSADDINRGPVPDTADRHSTFEGWDTISGYGRTNAWTMLSRVEKNEIPPEARIMSPQWFEVYNAQSSPAIPVNIRAVTATAKPMEVTLSVAGGVETSGMEFETLFHVADTGSLDEVVAKVEISKLLSLPRSPLDHERDRNGYTFLLKVKDVNGLVSESRRSIFIVNDPTLLPQFPRKLPGSGESSGLFVDVNDDGAQEYVHGDGAGLVHAWTHNGREAAGFPVGVASSRYRGSVAGVDMQVWSSIFAPVAAGDLNGDGKPEIVAATLEGQLTAIQSNGQALPGFPVNLPDLDWSVVDKHQVLADGVMASPVIADIDQDGQQEIVVVALDGYVYVYRNNGQPQPGFPVRVEVEGRAAKLLSSPAVFDLDKDGALDLVMGSNHVADQAGYIFAMSGRGRKNPSMMVAGFPVRIPVLMDASLPTVGWGIPASPAIGDVDGDQVNEIIVHGFVGKTYCLGLGGEIKSSSDSRLGSGSPSQETHMLTAFAQPALGDVDGDGILDILAGGAGRRALTNIMLGGTRLDYDHLISAWNGKTQTMFAAFPQRMDDMQLINAPLAADVSGDDKLEILMGSGGYYLRAFGLEGEIKDMAKFTGGWILGTPSVGDFDGDGKAEIAATTREGYLFIWKTGKAISNKNAGATFKGGPERRGIYNVQ